jgi:5-methylcytosine-specific restriction endonuclease McrA
MKRTPLKRKAALKRKGPIKRPPLRKVIDTEERDKMWDLFMEIWKERPHKSQVSGAVLWSEPKTWMFDHLLEKSKHPELKYEKENIILVTFEEHERKTNGFPDEKHKELIERAKVIFNIS